MILYSNPILAIISSINPRALISAPIADDSRQLKPVAFMLKSTGRYLESMASDRITKLGIKRSADANTRKLVLSPEKEKNNGNKKITATSCSFVFNLD